MTVFRTVLLTGTALLILIPESGQADGPARNFGKSRFSPETIAPAAGNESGNLTESERGVDPDQKPVTTTIKPEAAVTTPLTEAELPEDSASEPVVIDQTPAVTGEAAVSTSCTQVSSSGSPLVFYPEGDAGIEKTSEGVVITLPEGAASFDGKMYKLEKIEFPKVAPIPVNSVSYPMEVRFYNKAEDGSVAVISVPVIEGAANLALESAIADANTMPIDPDSLLPSDRLAAPVGCAGNTQNYLAQTPITASAAQIEAFSKLF